MTECQCRADPAGKREVEPARRKGTRRTTGGKVRRPEHRLRKDQEQECDEKRRDARLPPSAALGGLQHRGGCSGLNGTEQEVKLLAMVARMNQNSEPPVARDARKERRKQRLPDPSLSQGQPRPPH
ncbi:UNVERIFIED_CONTAM: hypothetical protein K2H54_038224 [Gekko kuhli]